MQAVTVNSIAATANSTLLESKGALETNGKQDRNGAEKSRRFREKLGEEIPIPGLSEALKAKRIPATVCWAVVGAALISCMIYFTVQLLDEYNNDPTATKVKMVRFPDYPFPPVVLCVNTWVDARRAIGIGLTEEGLRYSLSYLIAPYEIYSHASRLFKNSKNTFEFISQNDSDARSSIKKPSKAAKTNFEEVYRKQNFSSLIDYFNYIALDGTRHSSDGDKIEFDCVGCEYKEVEKVIIERDVCYKILLQSVAARAGKSSIWHELIIRVPDRTNGIIKPKTYWKLYMSAPIAKLAPRDPFVSIAHGQTHIVRLTSEHSLEVNTAKEPCEEKADPHMANYSTMDCEYDCIRREIRKVKRCNLFNLDKDFGRNLSEYCHIYDAKTWARDLVDDMMMKVVQALKDSEEEEDEEEDAQKRMENTMTGEDEEDEATCMAKCLPECETWRYKLDVDSHYSRRRMAESTKTITTAKLLFINSDAIAGGILTFTEIDTYTFDTLVSNVGGIWGLWTGASIVTLIQLGACCITQCNRCQRRGLQPLRSRRLTRRAEEDVAP